MSTKCLYPSTTCLPAASSHFASYSHPSDLWKLVCLYSTLKSIRLLYCSFTPLNSCMFLRRHAFFPLRNVQTNKLHGCLSCCFFLATRLKFLHFISRIFITRTLLSVAYKKQTLPLIGWSKKYLSVKYCDFLTPTNSHQRWNRKSTGRWEILLIQPVGMASKSTTAANYVLAPLVMVSLGAW